MNLKRTQAKGVMQMEEKRISELEKKVERLEKAFQYHLDEEEKSLRFLKRIVSDLKRIINL